METRLATLADVPAMAHVHAESFGTSRWTADQIRDSLNLSTTQGLVAVDGEKVRGFLLYQSTGDEAEILTICVSRSARQQGAGRMLLATAIEVARENDVRHMFLEVATDNTAALSLYEKAGFQKLGIRCGYYHQDGKSVDGISYGLDL